MQKAKKSNLYRFIGSFNDDMLYGGEQAESTCSNKRIIEEKIAGNYICADPEGYL